MLNTSTSASYSTESAGMSSRPLPSGPVAARERAAIVLARERLGRMCRACAGCRTRFPPRSARRAAGDPRDSAGCRQLPGSGGFGASGPDTARGAPWTRADPPAGVKLPFGVGFTSSPLELIASTRLATTKTRRPWLRKFRNPMLRYCRHMLLATPMYTSVSIPALGTIVQQLAAIVAVADQVLVSDFQVGVLAGPTGSVRARSARSALTEIGGPWWRWSGTCLIPGLRLRRYRLHRLALRGVPISTTSEGANTTGIPTCAPRPTSGSSAGRDWRRGLCT